MKTIVKIIIGIIIIICIIIGIIIVLFRKDNTMEGLEVFEGIIELDDGVGEDYKVPVETEQDVVVSVGDADKYNTVKGCLMLYYGRLNKAGLRYYDVDESGAKTFSEEKNHTLSSEIYDILGDAYIEENEITVANLDEKITFLDTYVNIIITDMKVYSSMGMEQYVVSYVLQDYEYNFLSKANMYVQMDTVNYTYSLTPISAGIEIDKSFSGIEVKESGANAYDEKKMDEYEICVEYFNYCKRLMLSNPELLYENLYSSYKSGRFSTVESFVENIENRREEIKYATLKEYQTIVQDGYIQYVLVDGNMNYYIVNQEKFGSSKSIILDTHTVELPEFVEKYDAATDENKVALNMEKIKSAINSQDYRYVYEKMDETFVENNIGSYEQFVEVMNRIMYDKNEFDYTSVSHEGSIYIVKFKIKDYSEEETDEFSAEVLMKLKDDRDFVFSWNLI